MAFVLSLPLPAVLLVQMCPMKELRNTVPPPSRSLPSRVPRLCTTSDTSSRLQCGHWLCFVQLLRTIPRVLGFYSVTMAYGTVVESQSLLVQLARC
mmetsp:Transcript_118459/g.377605  ORF Transcript_118459/g.377605 Transcript_118459/m.377605 type:complete len:96 (-) Transcript_118459:2706-2993(-)